MDGVEQLLTIQEGEIEVFGCQGQAAAGLDPHPPELGSGRPPRLRLLGIEERSMSAWERPICEINAHP
jgi:hypothetical protein